MAKAGIIKRRQPSIIVMVPWAQMGIAAESRLSGMSNLLDGEDDDFNIMGVRCSDCSSPDSLITEPGTDPWQTFFTKSFCGGYFVAGYWFSDQWSMACRYEPARWPSGVRQTRASSIWHLANYQTLQPKQLWQEQQ